MKVGIDASNLRVGGGITHLTEVLSHLEPAENGLERVIVWGGSKTLDKLPHKPWLIRSHQPLLDRSLPFRIFWQSFRLNMLAQKECDILFVPGGSYLGSFHPFVTMSRNMLPFEKGETRRYGISPLRLKFFFLRFSQLLTFKRSDGIIFLNEYAKNKVLGYIKIPEEKIRIIPHGVDARFRREPAEQRELADFSEADPIDLLYVSHIEKYKHQWHVIEAVASLRDRGIPIVLTLAGAMGSAKKELHGAITQYDPEQEFLRYVGKVEYGKLESTYHNSDLFIYASTCENLPNTLLEAMASGLPILSSNRGPMPEMLQDGGVYFDPERPSEIIDVLLDLIQHRDQRENLAWRSYELAQNQSWDKCVESTFSFLKDISNSHS